MAIEKYSDEQIQKTSMIELANKILSEQKKEMNFIDLFHKVAEVKSFSASMEDELLARFYTDLNIDGRFTTLGSNIWGLKRWYPVDQTSEKSLAETRKRDAEEALEEYPDEDTEEEQDEESEYEDYDLDYNEDDE